MKRVKRAAALAAALVATAAGAHAEDGDVNEPLGPATIIPVGNLIEIKVGGDSAADREVR